MNEKMNEFTKKYKAVFEAGDEAGAESSAFGDECRELGFKCEATLMGFDGEVLRPLWEKHPEAMSDSKALKKILGEIDDPFLLGTLIFSRWRLLSHGDYCDLVHGDAKDWFVAALSRLEELSV